MAGHSERLLMAVWRVSILVWAVWCGVERRVWI